MATEEEEVCGDDLAILLKEGSSPDNTLRIAKEIGFNVSPIFGAKKKKFQIQSELAMINAALIIFAVNQVVDENKAKPIIDEFLKQSSRYVFEGLAQRDKKFSAKYEERQAQYFGILSKEQAQLGLSFSLMSHLGINPIEELEGQLLLVAHISAMIKEAIAIVAVEKNSETISSWSGKEESANQSISKLSADEYGINLRAGYAGFVNSKALKSVGKEIGYSMSFFKPRKKKILLEELIFSNIAIVIHAVNLHKDISESKIIIDSFLASMRSTYDSYAEREPEFKERYSSRLTTYFALFQNGGDLIGFSTQFFRFLYNDNSSLPDPKALIFMTIRFGTFLKEMEHFLNNAKLVEAIDDLDDETYDDEIDPELQKKLDEGFKEIREEDETIDDLDDELDPFLQYYEAIEKHIETIGHKEPVLIAQGLDPEFCEASFKLYEAGYEHDRDFKYIACQTADAAYYYDKDCELAFLMLEEWATDAEFDLPKYGDIQALTDGQTPDAELQSARLKEAVAASERGDTSTAMREIKEVAEHGNIIAQAVLGMIYEQGKGVPINHRQAARWYLMAAEQGHTKAQAALSLMYMEGRGVTESVVNAHLWSSLVVASREGKSDPEILNKAREGFEENLKNMTTPAQAAKARDMVANWKPKKFNLQNYLS